MTTRTAYQSVITRLHATEGTEQSNRQSLAYRSEDLNNLGKYGYVLVGTVTAPESDGVTVIIDSLMLVEEIEDPR